MKTLFAFALMTGPALAAPIDVIDTTNALFDDLPSVVEHADFDEECGRGEHSHPAIGFCTSDNTIYVIEGFFERDFASYELAHVYGHAIQVRHGVADVALRAISSRRDEEEALRGMVTRQVECVAGVLMVRAGEPAARLRDLTEEPFDDAHWGRRPLNSGPQVSIGLEARAEWYDIGYAAQDFSACTVGEMSSNLIVEAER